MQITAKLSIFPTGLVFQHPRLYLKISSSYPAFQNLLKKAGLTRDKEYRYTFISDNENYTVFVPTAAALAAYNTDTLTTDELKKFLLMHFVQGDIMFTDGKMPRRLLRNYPGG